MIDKTNWTEEEIQSLIDNDVKENINLDYKACDSLAKKNDNCKKELSKDVSAFANSDGGIIIYGVVEEGHIPVTIDNGFDPNVVDREWIEQVIDSNIKRKVDGIRIYQVDLSGEKRGRVVYVISIPQSTDAPHMANDNRYYKRYNFKSNPMEDYEVRDVRRRNDHPNLKLDFKVKPASEDGLEKEISIGVFNTSSVPAEYYGVRLFIDKKVLLSKHSEFRMGTDSNIVISEDQTFLATCLIKPVYGSSSIPIWEGEHFELTTLTVIPPTSEEETYYMGWQVSGPGFVNSNIFTITL